MACIATIIDCVKVPPPSLLKACEAISPHKPLGVVKFAYDQALLNFKRTAVTFVAEILKSPVCNSDDSPSEATETLLRMTTMKMCKIKQIMRYHNALCLWNRTLVLESMGGYKSVLNASQTKSALEAACTSILPSTLEEGYIVMQPLVPANCWNYFKLLHPYNMIVCMAIAEDADTYIQVLTQALYHKLSFNTDSRWRTSLWLEAFAVGTLIGAYDAPIIKRFKTVVNHLKRDMQYRDVCKQLELLLLVITDEHAARAVLQRGQISWIRYEGC